VYQGSQPPPEDFDQLVEGLWPISTSCPPGGLCGGASALWREIWSKHPLTRAQNLGQLVEGLSNISEKGAFGSRIRPVDEVACPGVYYSFVKITLSTQPRELTVVSNALTGLTSCAGQTDHSRKDPKGPSQAEEG
jgi:hypothetical protein